MQINVEFKDPATGKEWDIEVPDDVAIGELLPAMLRESRLSLCGTDCQLLNQRTGTVYAECETLRERTLEGDTLLLVHANASGPDVRVDLEIAAVAAVELCHPALPDRHRGGEVGLRFGDRLGRHVGKHVVGDGPGCLGCRPRDDVEPDPEAELAPMLGGLGL